MIFEEDKKPEVMSMANVGWAIAVHLVLFFGFWLYGVVNFAPKEVVIPIELMFEAPPAPPEEEEEVKPVVQQPKPEVKHEERIVKPEETKMDAVEQVKEKPKPKEKKLEKKPEKKPEEKNVEEKKPEKKVEEKPKPKPKTKEQLKKERAERLKKMRDSSTIKKGAKPTPVAGTGKKLDERWKELTKMGYKAGHTTQLAANESQRCISLIKMALDKQWDAISPKIGQPGTVVLEVTLTSDGHITNCRIAKSCGSKMSDDAALQVARTVGRVYGLSPEFIAQNKTLQINYRVQGR